MRYWAFLVLKLLVASAMCVYLWTVLVGHFWDRLLIAVPLMGLTVWLLCGLVFVSFLDHRYRCRVCLRRLRMPVLSGSWGATLLNHAATEYICPYGHGKLSVPEVELTGTKLTNWTRYKGMWQELFADANERARH